MARREGMGDAGLFRRQQDGFTVFSFQPELLDRLARELRWVDAKRPAQLRLRVAELSQTSLAPFANVWGYRRTRQSSLGNLRLMQEMIEQFHVPASRAKAAAELVVDAKLVCPLGGQYVFREGRDGFGTWTSTALESEPAGGSALQVPAGFQAPPLAWFRGLSLDALLEPEAVTAHAELIMEMPPAAGEAKPKPVVAAQ